MHQEWWIIYKHRTFYMHTPNVHLWCIIYMCNTISKFRKNFLNFWNRTFLHFSKIRASSTQNWHSVNMVGPKFSLFSKMSSLIIFDHFWSRPKLIKITTKCRKIDQFDILIRMLKYPKLASFWEHKYALFSIFSSCTKIC